MLNASWATVEGAGGGTFGFQPDTLPVTDAKMEIAGPLEVPLETTKSEVGLKTCPVGCPLGMETSRDNLMSSPKNHLAISAAFIAAKNDTLRHELIFHEACELQATA